jgi:hypothetical protein
MYAQCKVKVRLYSAAGSLYHLLRGSSALPGFRTSTNATANKEHKEKEHNKQTSSSTTVALSGARYEKKLLA